jgi:serine/threonine-protein kinase
MSTTTFHEVNGTRTWGADDTPCRCEELVAKYKDILREERMHWTEHHRFLKLLGSGGQGFVYLSERRGTDSFTLPVALKIFSPERYCDEKSYSEAMGRIARVSAQIAQIQQDNLLDVHNWLEHQRIRLMEMEWVDGYDLSRLLTKAALEFVCCHIPQSRWEYINQVILTGGPVQPRVKPGIAIAIIRDCLAALAALHRKEIVHGDIKPSNIMLKRTGNAKIIDVGSAFEVGNPPLVRTCTPVYAAPEVLEGEPITPRSDIASLGYVLIEMLSGMPPFDSRSDFRTLLEAKRFLAQKLPTILPKEVACNELLMNFCRKMIAPDPARRFPTAEAADLLQEGAASFLRQLVKGDLASEYDNDIRLWLKALENF